MTPPSRRARAKCAARTDMEIVHFVFGPLLEALQEERPCPCGVGKVRTYAACFKGDTVVDVLKTWLRNPADAPRAKGGG